MDVYLRKDAEQDIIHAAGWYEDQRPGLGGEFLDEALRTLTLIGENPTMFPDVHGGVRRALVGRFPFGIFYRVEKKIVVALSVMHGRRSLQRWRERT